MLTLRSQTYAIVLVLASLCASAAQGSPSESPAELWVREVPMSPDPIALSAEGWTQESPGLWVRALESGGRELQAYGPEALAEVVRQLKGEAEELRQGADLDFHRRSKLAAVRALIQDLQREPDKSLASSGTCQRSGTAYASTSPSTHQCGAHGWAIGSVSSNSACTTSCRVSAYVWAEGACSATSQLEGRFSSCVRDGTTVTCTAYADWPMAGRCEPFSYSSVVCTQEQTLFLSDSGVSFTCGTGLPCYCGA